MKLKGLCDASRMDKTFILTWRPLTPNPWNTQEMWIYQGQLNTTLRFLGDQKWEIADNNFYYKTIEDKKKASKILKTGQDLLDLTVNV